jgi:hypothetical protein
MNQTYGLGPSLKLDSAIISHVYDEISLFIPKYVTDTSGFDTLLGYFLPSKYSDIAQSVTDQYKIWTNGNNNTEMAKQVIRDALFTCNTRYLYNSMSQNQQAQNAYMMDYQYLKNFDLAVHGSDLLPTFWDSSVDLTCLSCFFYNNFDISQLCDNDTTPDNCISKIENRLSLTVSILHKNFQNYLVSHAINDTPNWKDKSILIPTWKPVVAGDTFTNVMQVNYNGLSSAFTPGASDQFNTAPRCTYWSNIANQVMERAQDLADRDRLHVQDIHGWEL